MGVGAPERLRGELLEVVRITLSPGLYSEADTRSLEGAVETALRLWAERGNPVSDELDRMIARAVQKAMAA